MNVAHVYLDQAELHPIINSYLNNQIHSVHTIVIDNSGLLKKSLYSKVKSLVKKIVLSDKSEKIDWYQCHDIISYFLVLILKGRDRIIFDAHEIYSSYAGRGLTKIFFYIEYLLHKIAKKSIFPNKSRARLFFSNKLIKNKNKVFIVENLLDNTLLKEEDYITNKKQANKSNNKLKLLCAGTFTEIRAIEEIAESCGMLIQDGFDVHLDLVGVPNGLATSIAKEYNFTSLKGRVDRADLLNSYHKYDISFALYKPVNLNNKYCAPTKLFENEFFELRTLINNTSYLMELVERGVVKNCIIAESCESKAIYSALKQFLSNRKNSDIKNSDKESLLWSSQIDIIKSLYESR